MIQTSQPNSLLFGQSHQPSGPLATAAVGSHSPPALLLTLGRPKTFSCWGERLGRDHFLITWGCGSVVNSVSFRICVIVMAMTNCKIFPICLAITRACILRNWIFWILLTYLLYVIKNIDIWAEKSSNFASESKVKMKGTDPWRNRWAVYFIPAHPGWCSALALHPTFKCGGCLT